MLFRSFSLDVSGGFLSGIKSWFKSQMDDEQTVHFPAQHLLPGRSIRISVEQKFSEGPRTVEVTLPPDFVVGRPIRLKGLGRKLGPSERPRSKLRGIKCKKAKTSAPGVVFYSLC